MGVRVPSPDRVPEIDIWACAGPARLHRAARMATTLTMKLRVRQVVLCTICSSILMSEKSVREMSAREFSRLSLVVIAGFVPKDRPVERTGVSAY